MMSALNESFWDRLVGVVSLNRATYELLQRDPAATGQAWFIVAFLGLANGIAMIVTPIVSVMPGMSDPMAQTAADLATALTFDTAERQVLALVAGVVGAIVSWYLSSWLLRVIGNRMAGRTVSSEEMRRLVGWGYSPTLASFLTPIPLIGPLLATIGTFWALVTGVMALRAAFEIGVGKAIAIGIAAFLVVLVVVMVILFIIIMIAWPSA
jgi:hypothetical protein